MNLLQNLKIGKRLTLGFAAVLALTVLVGAFSISRIAKVNDATRDLATNWLPAMRALGEYNGQLSLVRRAEASHLLSAKPEEREVEERRIEAAKVKAQAAWQRYVKTIDSDAERALARGVEDAQRAYLATMDKLLPVSRSGDAAEARAAYKGAGRDAYAALSAALAAAVEFQTKGGDAAYASAEDAYGQALNLVLALLALAVAVGSAMAWLITRSITAPIHEAVKVAETVAAGDLRSKVEARGSDETGQLLAALRKMNDSLVAIVGQVRNSSDSIATGSAQIATGNADLSQRTEEQASNLQQTAASMEQLTATVKQNAETARTATQLASSASAVAAQGGEVVGQVVATMQAISDSSKRIADIIGVIDGIAFQTNILALNAAVEAARAGDQGRGFAVVAAEVRSLAQRSAQAAREIKTLIGESVVKVESGSALVGTAGRTMDEIVAQVKRVADLIGEISAASVEQSSGIGQIGDAVSQLDQVTQQNAALVEESAAAAESLKHQAAQLAQTVAVFRLELVRGQSSVAVAAPAAGATARRVDVPTPVPKPAAPAAKPAATADEQDWTAF